MSALDDLAEDYQELQSGPGQSVGDFQTADVGPALCTVCGQLSGRAAECWACFVAGDDAYRRVIDP